MINNLDQNKSSSAEPLVSVIILNWNGKKYLDDCFTSLENQTLSDFEIIMADNGSTDDSINFVRENFPRVKIVENKKNLGFAEGNNKGIEKALGEYIFVLNNDTKINKNCLEELVRTAKSDGKIGMCGAKIVSFENPELIDSVGVNIYFDGMSRGRGRKEIDAGQYDKIEEILFPSGCAAFYNKKMLDQIGLFDETFFAYCEDSDLGLRGRLAGWKAVLVPSAIVYHHYSGSFGKYSSLKAFLVERNHFWVAFKNFPLLLLLLLPVFTILRYLFLIYGILTQKNLARNLQFPKTKLFPILIKAYISALIGLPAIIKRRHFVSKNKKITNKEIINLIKKFSLKLREITFND